MGLMGSRVRVKDNDSMYRGWVGTVVEPTAARTVVLGNLSRKQLRAGGAVLVEGRSGMLFVVPVRALEVVKDG